MSPLTPSHQPESEPRKPKSGNLPVMKCVQKVEDDLALLGKDEMPSHNFIMFFKTACFLFKSTFSVRQAMRQDMSELAQVRQRLEAVYHHPALQRLKADPSNLGPMANLGFIIGFFEGEK